MNHYQRALVQAKERFEKDTAEHVLSIYKDDGVFRHLIAKKPGTSQYWFTITTWPGHLAISGDMGAYLFKRENDMLPWFGSWRINPGYWAEKLVAVDKQSKPLEYSEAEFRRWVAQHFWERREEYTPKQAKELWALIRRDVLKEGSYIEDVASYEAAYDALREFEALDFPEFEYEDYWDNDWQEFTIHYLWCCHAIVWAIREYRKQHEEAIEAARATLR